MAEDGVLWQSGACPPDDWTITSANSAPRSATCPMPMRSLCLEKLQVAIGEKIKGLRQMAAEQLVKRKDRKERRTTEK